MLKYIENSDRKDTKMKIAVINGSPKGEYSITLQTVRYLAIMHPEHKFDIINAGSRIRALEKSFDEAREIIEGADAIIFSYPVYTFICPSQLHRFIELMKEAGMELSGKYATQISTSKHFYDVTAHKYIEENSLDLGLRYVRGLSADMEDLLTEQGRSDAEKFFDRFIWSCENGIYERREGAAAEYEPVAASADVPTRVKKNGKDIVIITDNCDEDSNLSRMIERFRASLPYETRLVELSRLGIKGGCLGCFRCAVSERCVYKDGFDSYLREKIQTADSIIYAFTVKEHSMGSAFKMYDDRNFCNGHRTVTVGMPIGYLISGNYSAENNLKMIIEARAETGGNFIAGIATDESDPDREIDELVRTLEYCIEKGHTAPQSFYGVGGMRIFRDLIYGMRGMMRADHKFYKKQGIYKTFPQKQKGRALKMYLVGMLLSNEKILAKMGSKMNEGMLAPYEKMFAKIKK